MTNSQRDCIKSLSKTPKFLEIGTFFMTNVSFVEIFRKRKEMEEKRKSSLPIAMMTLEAYSYLYSRSGATETRARSPALMNRDSGSRAVVDKFIVIGRSPCQGAGKTYNMLRRLSMPL